ncbi:MAG: alpha/beta hydrolase [Trebonia sp.]
MRTLGRVIALGAAVVVCAGLAACSSASGAGTVPGSSSDVSFVVDGTTTYGTLEVPAHRSGQRLAAALLIPGSGPTNRDGNDPGLGVTPDTLLLVAGILARQGIMTFRYDKYFTGQTGSGAFASDPDAATVTSFARQAEAAYAFLKSQPDADPGQILIVGHSEGGMYALVVADSVTGKPAGLALLEPQDERILGLVERQTDEKIDSLVAEGQLSGAEGRGNADAVRRAISQFRAGQTVSTEGMSPMVVQLLAPEIMAPSVANYLRSDEAIVPASYAARMASGTRVLVTDGTRDPNVPPSTIGPLADALATPGTTGPGLRILQGTDHYMHLDSQPDNEPVLAPAAVAAIAEWAEPFASAPESPTGTWTGENVPGRISRPRPSGPGRALRGSLTPNKSPSCGDSTETRTPHRDFRALAINPV